MSEEWTDLVKKRRAYGHNHFKKGGRVGGGKGSHRAFGGRAETKDQGDKKAGHDQSNQETAWDKKSGSSRIAKKK